MRTALILFASTLLTIAATAETPIRPAPAKKVAVKTAYHGQDVSEDYRWLEDWKAPEVQAWSKAQNRWARHQLDGLPGVATIGGQVAKLLGASGISYGAVTTRPGMIFALKRQPPRQQPFLVMLPIRSEGTAASADEQILVDPNELGTIIDWVVPSPDGRLVAISMSKGGTESGDVSVYDTATRKRVFEVIPRVNGGTAGGSLAWAPDAKGFFYTRYPRGKERPAADMDFHMQLYFHELGTPTEGDRYEMGKELPRIAEIQVDMDLGSGRLLATVQKGDGGQFAHYLRGEDGSWRQFSRFGDRILEARFGPKNTLYVLSRAGAPRGKIHRVPIASLDVAASKVIIPEGKDTIVEDFWGGHSIVPTRDHLFLLYQLGGPSEIRVFTPDGKRARGPKQAPVSAVLGMTRFGTSGVLFGVRSYISPIQWLHYDTRTGKTRNTTLSSERKIDFSDATVVREMATSKDGTQVPVNIVMPRGARRDAKGACLATGYGGFGVARAPRFRPWLRLLLDHGVCYAAANLRGGSEFGSEWHEQGRLEKKQNVFDDFAAVIRHLKRRGYAARDRVGILGGSNGGLLMGATMVQHPDLARAVISWVGIYDMLRVELSPNGAFNVTEYGTTKNKTQFDAMFAYSPYHRVQDGTPYPASLFLTGENDPRVDPMQSRKMVARLQAATSGQAPILLRTTSNAGHGLSAGLDVRVAEYTHVMAFLFHHLGVKVSDR